ncbi:zinc finger protein 883-like [Ptychodera flava]|uniref:zinc finger protein 883-like n=1 Tax=Ptychodera flava TaxID=63121 RepID=UPI00396A699C
MDGFSVDVREAGGDEHFKEARPQTDSTEREGGHQISESYGGLDAVVEIKTEPVDVEENHSMQCEDGKLTTNQDGESVQANPRSDDEAADSKSPNQEYKCSECAEIFTTKAAARKHVELHMFNGRDFGCDLCGASFKEPMDYAKHMYAGRCEHDGGVSEEDEEASSGLEGPSGEGTKKKRRNRDHFCKHCGDLFMGVQTLRKHMKDIHGEKLEFKCERCDKIFAKKSNLLRHVRAFQNRESCSTRSPRSMENSDIHCPVCQKKFGSNWNLTIHMRLHSGDKPFKCRPCDKAYTSKQSLIEHQQSVHSDVKPILCEVCGKRFHRQVHLRRHMVQHLERKYQCRTCGMRFLEFGKFTAHTKKHNGVFLFPCCYCDRKFKAKQQQIGHIRTHTGDRPYRCPVCDRGFTLKKAMVKHNKLMHSNERKFGCQACGKRYKENWALNKHVRDAHQTERTENGPQDTETESGEKLHQAESGPADLNQMEVPQNTQSYSDYQMSFAPFSSLQ